MVIARLEGADTSPITPVPVLIQPGLKLLHGVQTAEQQLFLYSREIWRQTFLIMLVMRT